MSDPSQPRRQQTSTEHEFDPSDRWSQRSHGTNPHASVYSFQSGVSVTTQDEVPLITTKQLPVTARDTTSRHHYQWRPLSLRRWYLLLLFLIFSALWASLLILRHLNTSEDGFRLTITSNHLAWKYGPTGILVIAVSLWRQVDYHCKSLQPWQNLVKGTSTAEQSLLLDYLWPLQVESFWVAIRSHHWRVVFSTGGFMILKFVTLVSTALILAVDTLIPMEVDIRFDNRMSLTASGNETLEPLDAYLGLLGGSISPTEGVQGGLVFRTFDLIDNTTTLNSITTPVRVFVPRMECEEAEVKLVSFNKTTYDEYLSEYGEVYFNYTLSTSTCAQSDNPSGQLYSDETQSVKVTDCKTQVCPSLVLNSDFLDCNNPMNSSYEAYDSSLNLTNIRFVAFAINFTATRNSGTSANSTDYSLGLANSAAVFCKVDHSLETWNVTRELTSGDLVVSIPSGKAPSSKRLTDLSVHNLTYELYSQSTNDATNPKSPGLMSGIRRTISDDVTFDYSLFFKSNNLLNATNTTLAGVAAQYVQENYMLPERSQGNATAVRYETRLHIASAPLWGMIVGLAAVSLFAIILAIYDVPHGLPQRPASKATIAAVFTSSPGLQSLLENTGHMSNEELKQRTIMYSFRAHSSQDSFCIEKTAPGVPIRDDSNGSPGVREAWLPFSARRMTIAITMLLPVVAIIVLEILWRVSYRNEGLGTASLTSFGMRYVYPFVAPLIMFLVATMFNLLDFMVAVIAPYQSLKNAASSASRLMFIDLLGHTPPVALYESLRRQHFGSVLSNVAALIGSILTIVASGLLVTESVFHTTEIRAQRSSLWDWNWTNSSLGDNQAGERYERIRLNTSGPSPYVWNDLVFPDVQQPMILDKAINASVGPINNTNMEYTLTLPALRPQLVCEVVDNYTTYVYDETADSVNVSTSAPLADGCRGGQAGNLSTITWLSEYDLYLGNRSYMTGYLYDLHLGPWNKSETQWLDYGEGDPNVNQPDNSPGCPSIGVHFGDVTTLKNETNQITSLLCWQKTEQIEVTYGKNTAGKIHNDTAILLTNGSRGIDSFGYRWQRHLSNLYQPLGNLSVFTLDTDYFYDVLNGSYTTADELTGKDNVTNLLDAMQIFYKAYQVNAIDQNFRKSRSQLSEAARQANQSDFVSGTLKVSLLRLKVDKSSKTILQALLATMTVLGLAAYCLVEIRGVLPRNPCTIASTMGFFADGSLCSRYFMPVGAEWMTERSLRPSFDRHRFSLGWWHKPALRESVISEDGSEIVTKEGKRGMRFGIDKGQADLLGFSQNEHWYSKLFHKVRPHKVQPIELERVGGDVSERDKMLAHPESETPARAET